MNPIKPGPERKEQVRREERKKDMKSERKRKKGIGPGSSFHSNNKNVSHFMLHDCKNILSSCAENTKAQISTSLRERT